MTFCFCCLIRIQNTKITIPIPKSILSRLRYFQWRMVESRNSQVRFVTSFWFILGTSELQGSLTIRCGYTPSFWTVNSKIKNPSFSTGKLLFWPFFRCKLADSQIKSQQTTWATCIWILLETKSEKTYFWSCDRASDLMLLSQVG